jgi:hypothetical protein
MIPMWGSIRLGPHGKRALSHYLVKIELESKKSKYREMLPTYLPPALCQPRHGRNRRRSLFLNVSSFCAQRLLQRSEREKARPSERL